jgi:hypothetical protein
MAFAGGAAAGSCRGAGRRELYAWEKAHMQARIFLLMVLALCSAGSPAADRLNLAAKLIEGQALFYDFRDLESRSHRERIRILETAEACIQQAHGPTAFRRCEREERTAREQLRSELQTAGSRLRARRSALLQRH